jgi:hypothetical protein
MPPIQGHLEQQNRPIPEVVEPKAATVACHLTGRYVAVLDAIAGEARVSQGIMVKRCLQMALGGWDHDLHHVLLVQISEFFEKRTNARDAFGSAVEAATLMVGEAGNKVGKTPTAAEKRDILQQILTNLQQQPEKN